MLCQSSKLVPQRQHQQAGRSQSRALRCCCAVERPSEGTFNPASIDYIKKVAFKHEPSATSSGNSLPCSRCTLITQVCFSASRCHRIYQHRSPLIYPERLQSNPACLLLLLLLPPLLLTVVSRPLAASISMCGNMGWTRVCCSVCAGTIWHHRRERGRINCSRAGGAACGRPPVAGLDSNTLVRSRLCPRRGRFSRRCWYECVSVCAWGEGSRGMFSWLLGSYNMQAWLM
jgi:hypothetical protein